MARHAAPTPRRRALLRAGLTVTAAGAFLGLGGVPAAVASATESDIQLAETGAASGQALVSALTHGTTGALTPVTRLKLNPLSGTGVDPLDNAVGTQVADFKPVSTAALTDPLTKGGGALQDLPLLGPALKLLLPGPSA
ncbi:hypothetical protein [Streptomyces lushanensis]|uniref:hypothetical protein n=1 Tax=Streptomyces lushanensis TaxID=1434255 RepID=UPI000833FA48|nr:hypothetical protein [Streptomyces lushanensis]